MLKIKRYLGFTDEIKEPRKTKVENELSRCYSYKGNIYNAVEFLCTKLLEGCYLEKEENYQYVKRNGELSKPKTLYMFFDKDVRKYFEMNKTQYDFVQYLIDKGLNTEESILAYDKADTENFEALQKAKEEEKARQEEEKQRREEEKEKFKSWMFSEAENIPQFQKDIIDSMALGFNGARLHQKVFEPRFLYYADKHGYMLWGEAGNWGWDHTDPLSVYTFVPEWLEEIERDKMHPSIIGWCPLNETWDVKGNGRRLAPELAEMIYNVTVAKDPTRPVIINSGFVPCYDISNNFIGAVFDVHDYTQEPEKFAEVFSELEGGIIKDQLYRNPVYRQRQVLDTTKTVFVSEYGGIGWVEEGDGWGYGSSVKSREEFIERLEGLTDGLRRNPLICGFCYTQLYDVEQEKNGIMTYERKFKFDPDVIKKIFSAPSVKETK